MGGHVRSERPVTFKRNQRSTSPGIRTLIIFPEGTRGAGRLPAPFKSGLYHLAERFPDVRLVPVYLENLHRSMPKGVSLPVPMICTVRFGRAL
jgi:1-acyl-sn-glycerol-3-phosphate acyltransferase